MLIDQKWIDKNGWLKPRLSMDSSGNGPLYTILYYAIIHAQGFEIFPPELLYVNKQLKLCEVKPGLYKRNPDGSYGQETWDDSLAIIVWCIITDDTAKAKSIFWYGVLHLGFYDTDGVKSKDDFLWRTVHVFWGLLIVAAFPWTRYLMWPIMWCYSKTLNASLPKVYLDWLWFYGASLRSFRSPQLVQLKYRLPTSLVFEMDVINPAMYAAIDLTQA
jgi:hypothetical protein